MIWVRRISVGAAVFAAGWLFCFISALVVFRKFQPTDFTLPATMVEGDE